MDPVKTAAQLLGEMSTPNLVDFLIEESKLEKPDMTIIKLIGKIIDKRTNKLKK